VKRGGFLPFCTSLPACSMINTRGVGLNLEVGGRQGGDYETLIQGEDCFKKKEVMMKEKARRRIDRRKEE
jgi:hypothetical protein